MLITAIFLNSFHISVILFAIISLQCVVEEIYCLSVFEMRVAIVVALVALCCASAFANSVSLPGGFSPVNDTSSLRETIEDALTQIADEHNVSWTLVEILSAQQQVVAGFRYVIETNLCDANETKRCTFDIWEQSWAKYRKATVSCQPENKEYTVERGRQSK